MSRVASSPNRRRQSPRGFDFCAHMRCLCRDIVERLPDLRHIDFDRVAVAFTQARNRNNFGLYASLTPMRFENGSATTQVRGRLYTAQRLFDDGGRELLYILTFCLPRFQDLTFDEKFTTVLHELWHISPLCNGDLRRHEGRCYKHTHSQRQYDVQMAALARSYLDTSPPAKLHQFLHFSFDELRRQHGNVFGQRIRHPKLIPLSS